MRFLGTVIALLGCGSISIADCGVRRRVITHEVIAVPVVPAIVATYVPIAVAVPSYSAQYQPQVDYTQQMQTLLSRIASLEQQLTGYNTHSGNATSNGTSNGGNPPKGESPAAKPNEQAANIGGLFKNKCASCHANNTAASKGGKFEMFLANGDLKGFNSLEVAKIAGKVYTGKMPKNGKLSDEEVGAIMDWVDQVTSK